MAVDAGTWTRVAANLWNAFLGHALADKRLFFFFSLWLVFIRRWQLDGRQRFLAALFGFGLRDGGGWERWWRRTCGLSDNYEAYQVELELIHSQSAPQSSSQTVDVPAQSS